MIELPLEETLCYGVKNQDPHNSKALSLRQSLMQLARAFLSGRRFTVYNYTYN